MESHSGSENGSGPFGQGILGKWVLGAWSKKELRVQTTACPKERSQLEEGRGERLSKGWGSGQRPRLPGFQSGRDHIHVLCDNSMLLCEYIQSPVGGHLGGVFL